MNTQSNQYPNHLRMNIAPYAGRLGPGFDGNTRVICGVMNRGASARWMKEQT